MRPQPDDYPDHIENALEALVRDGLEAGANALAPIAYPPRELRRERKVDRAMMVTVFKRDHFLCRYCGGKTILTPLMELMGVLYPDVFPFQSAGWKAGVTHPAVISRSPAVDHVVPVVYGGVNSDENLVTACSPCNTIKADFSLEMLGWELRPVEEFEWDGLTRFYPRLWDLAGRPKPQYHQGWMKQLGLGSIQGP
jgi:hypothetical protein